MSWKNIKFIGDGEYFQEFPDQISYVHFDGPLSDYTLCGWTLDGDTGTMGSYISTDELISCPNCIKVIKHCKSLKYKEGK